MPSLPSSEPKTAAKPPFSACDALVEVALGADELDLLDRQRRLLGELARPGQRGVEQLVVDDHAVDEAELEGLRRADRRRR